MIKRKQSVTRRSYTEAISKSVSVLDQYIYTHKNVLLRLEHQMLPAEAQEYHRVLKSL